MFNSGINLVNNLRIVNFIYQRFKFDGKRIKIIIIKILSHLLKDKF